MKLLREYLIIFFSRFAALWNLKKKNVLQVSCGGRKGPNAIYIYTEGTGKFLTNVFGIN
jgi:hypothetical protein